MNWGQVGLREQHISHLHLPGIEFLKRGAESEQKKFWQPASPIEKQQLQSWGAREGVGRRRSSAFLATATQSRASIILSQGEEVKRNRVAQMPQSLIVLTEI